MFLMMHGHMMMLTPVDKEFSYSNGTKVMADGAVMMKGKKMMLKEGQMISSEGVLMTHSSMAHGG